AAESEWLTCGAGSRVSACGKYADICRQRTARTATTTTRTTVNAGQLKAVMAWMGSREGALDEDKWKTKKNLENQKELEKQREKDKLENAKVTVFPEGQKQQLEEMKSKNLHVDVTEGEDRVSLRQQQEVQHRQQPGEHMKSVMPKKTELQQDGGIPEQEEEEVRDHRQQPRGDTNSVSQNGTQLHRERELGTSSVSTEVQEDLPHPEATKRSLTGSADSSSSPEAASEARTTLSKPTAISTAGEVNSNHDQPQTQSENTTENSNTNDGNPSQNHSPTETSTLTTPNPTQLSAAAPGTTGTEGSHENANADSTATTTNTTTEAPTTTPSPVPAPNAEISSTPTEAPTTNSTIPSLVPNAGISSIASTVQNKANADSGVNPVWMRTAAPLLIVAVLVSVTMY
ncbi:uncharacterized protein TM35_000641310, partial [Trypanosoma theileri]